MLSPASGQVFTGDAVPWTPHGPTGFEAPMPSPQRRAESIGYRSANQCQLESAARSLARQIRCPTILVTRGSRGMALFQDGAPPVSIPVHGTDQVADVTGAGDTVLATFSLALASGATALEAALLANFAGGVAVMKMGTAVVAPKSSGTLIARTGPSSVRRET